MRVLIVHPGVDYSVSDVFEGWARGFRKLGIPLAQYAMHDALAFYGNLHWRETGKLLPTTEIIKHACLGLHSKMWEWWPDLVVVISGFFIHRWTWEILQSRPHRVALICTESPYEDDAQRTLISLAEPDVVILNDPTNIDTYRGLCDTVEYLPHCYDPDIHHPGNGTRDLDFVFVGTGYPDRIRLFDQIDWTGLDFTLAGNWPHVEGTQLGSYLNAPPGECTTNADAADLYRRAKVSANRYRREANRADLIDGWALGPREVELAACQTFFCRVPRGESDELFPMLPTFTGPAELEQQIRWWSTHDRQREKAAAAARDRISDRTFENNVRRLLALANQ